MFSNIVELYVVVYNVVVVVVVVVVVCIFVLLYSVKVVLLYKMFLSVL